MVSLEQFGWRLRQAEAIPGCGTRTAKVVSFLGMKRPQFAVLFPSVSLVITFVLWLWARAQYLRHVCPPDGLCQPGSWILWTDYTPIALQLAGMLNVPVAIFADPLYHLSNERPNKWELLALLLCVGILWSYIGWIVDTRNVAPRPKTRLRSLAGASGFLFGVLLLFATVSMHHIGLLYKAVALAWSFLICRHFLRLIRNQAGAHKC
jgi:hypothetical protein